MKLILFPRYTKTGPSSRYRFYQYIPLLAYNNIEVHPFFDKHYVATKSLKNVQGIIYVCKLYAKRLYHMFRLSSEDVVFLQYEFTPFLFFNTWFFRIKKINYIVDYDDAVFHDYDQNKNILVRVFLKNKISKVIANAQAVITGSPYLTKYALKYNSNVHEIPTSINFSKYQPNAVISDNEKLIIGWIGSSTTSFHLRKVLDAFHILKEQGVNFEVRLIGYDKKEKINFENLPIKVIKWKEDTEIEELNKFNVGIMPLVDYPYAHGKCAFKLIQYMAMGKPTISSAFEANKKVDRNNENLFADTLEEWVKAFLLIHNNKSKYMNVGKRNREVIKNYYSIQSNNSIYQEIIDSIKV